MEVNNGVTFVDRLGSFGDAVALIVDDQVISYRQLEARVAPVAEQLGSGRLVAIAMASELDPLVAYLAALRARCPVIAVDADDTSQLKATVSHYDPDVVIVRSERGWSLTEVRPGSAHELHPDLALLLSTSGSTSSPKMVRLSAGNLSANAASIADYLAITDDDRAITTLPLNYCYGLSVVHSHLHRGASLVLTGESVLDPSFWRDVEHWGVTSFAGVPHTFELLDRVDFASKRLPSLRTITQAGGRLPPDRVLRFADLAERDGWRLFVMYGQTEATARMAYVPPDDLRQNPMAIGIPIPGGSMRIDPVEGMAEGTGELIYRGPNVMLGYATSTEELALGRTIDELRTGDLARQLPNGMFEIIGRATRFVKLFGRRVDLEQVERDLETQGIEAKCAGNDERLVVAVRDDAHVEAARHLVIDRIGLTAAVVSIVQLDEFPRLGNGKLDYEAISRAGEPKAPPAPPRRRLGFGRRGAPRSVKEGYASVFDRSDLSDDDTFVGLGGDSMSYIEASVHVEQALGHLPHDWHTKSIGDLQRSGRSRSLLRSVETNVVLRTVAILLIAGSHLSVFLVEGSAHVLIAVAGFNFWRFQLASVDKTDRSTGILASAARIAVPTLIFSAVLLIIDELFYPISFLMITNFVPQPDVGFRTDFWFVEALVQIMVLMFAVFSVPAVRAYHRRRPLRAAGIALAVGLLARYGLGGVWNPTYGGLPKTPHIVLWLFTLGWATAASTSVRHRLVLTGIGALALPGFFDYGARAVILGGGLLALIWIPKVPVPWPLNRLVALIANATLYIYLTHITLPEAIGFQQPIAKLITAVVGGIAISLVAERVMRAGETRLRTTLRQRRDPSHVRGFV
ncbi:MAG: AMP-binding protein [Actinomycetota bacterium]